MSAKGGRGRGRGRSALLEQMGISKEDIQAMTLHPIPEVFPPLQFKPLQFSEENLSEYLLVVKKDITATFQNSEYFIHSEVKKNDVERYSDKYQVLTAKKQLYIHPDSVPKELRIKVLLPKPTLKKRIKRTIKPILPKVENISLEDKFKELEKKETQIKEENDHHEPEDEEEEEDDDEKDSDDDDEEDVVEEEEVDDYTNAYFDNGDDDGGDDDDLEEGGCF